MLDVLQKHGHDELDTAYMYTNHTSEQYLGKVTGFLPRSS